MSRVLGIAGPYCSGKSTVAEILQEWGWREIDVDALGHAARKAKRREVVERFGTEDRSELRRIVFRDSEALTDLEMILHPWMREEAKRRKEEILSKGGRVLINAALLFPMGLQEECDMVLWIDAPLPLRYLRARRRDGLGLGDFLMRIRSQAKLYPQKERESVDIITIVNLGSRRSLQRKLRRSLGDSRMEM